MRVADIGSFIGHSITSRPYSNPAKQKKQYSGAPILLTGVTYPLLQHSHIIGSPNIIGSPKYHVASSDHMHNCVFLATSYSIYYAARGCKCDRIQHDTVCLGICHL